MKQINTGVCMYAWTGSCVLVNICVYVSESPRRYSFPAVHLWRHGTAPERSKQINQSGIFGAYSRRVAFPVSLPRKQVSDQHGNIWVCYRRISVAAWRMQWKEKEGEQQQPCAPRQLCRKRLGKWVFNEANGFKWVKYVRKANKCL